MPYTDSILAFEVQDDGDALSPRRKTLNFIGFTLADDPGSKRINITAADAQPRLTFVRLATAAALPANTRTSNTLTASGNGALSVDGTAVANGDDILVKNEATGANNGIYTVADLGSAGTPFVLTRRSDFDTSVDYFTGLRVMATAGSSNAGYEFVLTNEDAITLNTTALTFSSPGLASSLSAPDDPSDDGKVAVADGGDLTYLAGSQVGQVLSWTATGAAWGALDLADGDAVTGALPLANVTGGSAVGQVLRNATGNVPEWGAVNLADGDAVTGLLPLSNLTGGSAVGQVLRNTVGNVPAWGALDLADTDAVTGLLPVTNIAAGTDTYVLTTTAGVTGWAAPTLTLPVSADWNSDVIIGEDDPGNPHPADNPPWAIFQWGVSGTEGVRIGNSEAPFDLRFITNTNNILEMYIGGSSFLTVSTSGTAVNTSAATDAALKLSAGSNTVSLYESSGLLHLIEGERGVSTIDYHVGPYETENALTGASNTLSLAALGKRTTVSHGSATQLTVPPNSDVAYPVGTILNIAQIGAGQVEIVQGSGVTVNVSATYTRFLREQWSQAQLWKQATNTWLLTGDLDPA